jgi:hypothetical protein
MEWDERKSSGVSNTSRQRDRRPRKKLLKGRRGEGTYVEKEGCGKYWTQEVRTSPQVGNWLLVLLALTALHCLQRDEMLVNLVNNVVGKFRWSYIAKVRGGLFLAPPRLQV